MLYVLPLVDVGNLNPVLVIAKFSHVVHFTNAHSKHVDDFYQRLFFLEKFV